MGVLMTIIGAGVLITLVVLGLTTVLHDMTSRTTKQNPSIDERKPPEEQPNE